MYPKNEIDVLNMPFHVDNPCGIYFLIKESRIVYIGQSNNVYRRLGDHKKEKEFTSFKFIQCDAEWLDWVEIYYIHKFKPDLNARHNSGEVVAPIRSRDIGQMEEIMFGVQSMGEIKNKEDDFGGVHIVLMVLAIPFLFYAVKFYVMAFKDIGNRKPYIDHAMTGVVCILMAISPAVLTLMHEQLKKLFNFLKFPQSTP